MDVFENGPPAEKVDLLVIGEGYTEAELPKFHADAKRMVGELFARSRSRAASTDFNVRGLDLPSPASGVHRPERRRLPPHAASAEYNIFDSERYVLTFDDRALRDVASAAPYDFIEILVNEKTYGGGGIFNDQATASVDSAFSTVRLRPRVRRTTSRRWPTSTTRQTSPTRPAPREKPEPWEPNVTALHDPAQLKWRTWSRPARRCRRRGTRRRSRSTAARFRSAAARFARRNAPEAEMDALFREEQAWETKFLVGEQYAGRSARSRGPAYETEGTLSAADRLHHVHARRGRILPRVPAGHRADHGLVFAVNSRCQLSDHQRLYFSVCFIRHP